MQLRFKRKARSFRKRVNEFGKYTLQLVLVPFLILTSFVMILVLQLYLWTKRSKLSKLSNDALANVTKFVEQYPFHLYPVVCKSFELAFLEDKTFNLVEGGVRTIELAIGEGTLSKRIFPPDAHVVGLELNPYLLKQASQLKHVKKAIVCDCLQPPISEGSFDVLVANNFLHHITHKENALARWARIAEKALFNENTPYWASGWPISYVSKTIGLPGFAGQFAARIERESFQELEPKTKLDSLVLKDYEIVESVSYLSERTFFYCGVFSSLMRCYGPPTPRNLKRLFLGPLRWLAIPVTTMLAKLVIRFDEHQDRSRDAFVSYMCKSRHYVAARSESYLACPSCGGELNPSNRCTKCGTQCCAEDGMLFLLRGELKYIAEEYKPHIAAKMTPEQL
jgi:SAM-dependent methyltransferase